jgi:hypothetical protein
LTTHFNLFFIVCVAVVRAAPYFMDNTDAQALVHMKLVVWVGPMSSQHKRLNLSCHTTSLTVMTGFDDNENYLLSYSVYLIKENGISFPFHRIKKHKCN